MWSHNPTFHIPPVMLGPLAAAGQIIIGLSGKYYPTEGRFPRKYVAISLGLCVFMYGVLAEQLIKGV